MENELTIKKHYEMINVILKSVAAGLMMLPVFPCASVMSESATPKIVPGEVWKDVAGDTINAHGGCVLFSEGKYYWYGEHRAAVRPVPQEGVTVYSSPNLVDWTYEGLALKASEKAGDDIEKGCIFERPKVIYNPRTGKYVMWFHLELKGQGYGAARCAVAVSDSPAGPFSFVKSGRVNAGKMPLNLSKENASVRAGEKMEWWTPEWRSEIEKGMFTLRDLDGGQMSRDMTLFVDDDGKAYHIYSSEDNLTLQIVELTDDYLDHSGRYIRIFPGGHNEAPALMKYDGKYWMIASGCTGWEPNEARLMVAESMMGEWTRLPNPCVGENAEKTFLGQSNYILKVEGKENAYIAMFDRWNPKSLMDSRYLWLPVQLNGGAVSVAWIPEWSPSTWW